MRIASTQIRLARWCAVSGVGIGDPRLEHKRGPEGVKRQRLRPRRLAPRGPSKGKIMTYGERAVGLTFNPSGDPVVRRVKELFAQIIDICDGARSQAGQGEKGRLLSVAITEAQTAQMWAVKGITFPA
jgi:hypothetical protein